jgi:GT2 family glycosyltransferase
MNAALTLTHNCLDLTKRMYASVQNQTLPTQLFVVDNGSSDGTREWLQENHIQSMLLSENAGVSHGWNLGLSALFALHEHVLVLNNDTDLADWTLELLLSYDLPFVTGVGVSDELQIRQPKLAKGPMNDHPDFSLFLIRKQAWEEIGPFDERMKLYAQDCDYHLRGWRLGVDMKKACVPYLHESSATMKHAPPAEQQIIHEQANLDRAVFQSIYHCLPGTPEYYALFSKETFGSLKKVEV